MDLFDSERDIQRLRKEIADHCVEHMGSLDNPPAVHLWPAKAEGRNGHANGYRKVESNINSSEEGRGDWVSIELLRREVSELKEVIDRKEFLLQSYKEKKSRAVNED